MFERRSDATRVVEGSALRHFMPFVSTQRNHSLVYFSQEVDVETALAAIEERNGGRIPERRITLFHLILRALTRVLDEKPRLNRFVTGGKLWQRDGIWLSFSAKQAMDEDAPVVTVKLLMNPEDSLEDTVEQICSALERRRRGRREASDGEIDLLLRLPTPVIRLVMRVVRGLDAVGLLPARMIDPDPLYASAFIANLGSVGLDAAYHHLWEYGNIPVFCVVGRIREGEDGRRRITLKYTYDERVEDGLYAAHALELLRDLLEKPDALLR